MGNSSQVKASGMGDREKVLTILAIAAWLAVFLAGILINSGPYRTQIADGKGDFIAWLIVLMVYTPTNIAMLSLLMGLLGALGRCATLSVDEECNKESERDTINPLLSGVIRGFIVYMLTISGLLVVLEETPLTPLTPEPYIRLASIVSLTAFIVGFNPKYFGNLLNWARHKLQPTQETTEDSDSKKAALNTPKPGPETPPGPK